LWNSLATKQTEEIVGVNPNKSPVSESELSNITLEDMEYHIENAIANPTMSEQQPTSWTREIADCHQLQVSVDEFAEVNELLLNDVTMDEFDYEITDCKPILKQNHFDQQRDTSLASTAGEQTMKNDECNDLSENKAPTGFDCKISECTLKLGRFDEQPILINSELGEHEWVFQRKQRNEESGIDSLPADHELILKMEHFEEQLEDVDMNACDFEITGFKPVLKQELSDQTNNIMTDNLSRMSDDESAEQQPDSNVTAATSSVSCRPILLN